MLWHLGLAGQEKTTARRAPLRVWLSYSNQPIQSPTRNLLLYLAKPLSFCPNYFRARYQTNSDSFYAPGPPELFKPANPKPVQLLTLPRSFLPAKTIIKALAQTFPSLLLPPVSLVLPRVALRGLVCHLLLGTVSNKLSFRWQSSPDPSASPYPRESKILGTF